MMDIEWQAQLEWEKELIKEDTAAINSIGE